MNAPSSKWGRLRRAFRLPQSSEQIDVELRDEFRFHIEGRIEQFMQTGMTREQAEREVRKRFGDYEGHLSSARQIDAHSMRQQRRFEFASMLWSEVRHSARVLWRTPSFTVIAVLTLALGIGATTAIYTVLDAVVLRPLPYRNAGALVSVLHPANVPGSGERKWGVSPGGYFEFRSRTHTLKDFGIYRSNELTVTNNGKADIARVSSITSSIFTTLEARAEAGRLLDASDDRYDSTPYAVLSHEYVQRRFGGDTSIIGQNLETDRGPIQVVGIAEPGLTLPMPGPFNSQSNLAGFGIDVWLPLQLNPAGPFYNNHPFVGVGRLKEGVTVKAAQREFTSIMSSFVDVMPTAYSKGFIKSYNFRVEVSDLRNAVLGPNIPRALWMVLGSVVLVLIIAAANVANLFIVRTEVRRRETAIRSALGASRAHMAAHFLSEGLLLCGASAVMGVVLADLGLRGLLLIAPASIPRLTTLSLGGASIAVAFVVAAVLGILFGVIPLLRRVTVSTLREGGRGLSASPRQRFVRHGLVVGQVALALVLVTAAGLMTQSFWRLRNVKPGFDASNVTAFNLSLPFTEFDTREKAFVFHRELLREISELPGVTNVGASGAMPLEDFGTGCSSLYHDTPYLQDEKAPCVPPPAILPGFFETLRIPVEGRAPTWNDLDQHAQTVVVTKALADRMWPGQSAIGKHVNNNGPKANTWYTVVGVVSGVRAEALDAAPTEVAFFSRAGFVPNERTDDANDFVYFVRTRSAPTPALMNSINTLVMKLDARVPVVNPRTMQQVVEHSVSRTSFVMILLGVAAFVALALSAVGMYGVISYVVAQRRNEIGIRIALGAEVGEVARLIVLQSVQLAAAGVGIGLLLAFVTGKALTSMLFEVSPADPVTLAGVALLLITIAAFASFAPARRAAAIDPLEAMRTE